MKMIHNALPSSIFSNVKSTLEEPFFPWYYVENTAYGSSSDKLNNGSFFHTAFDLDNGIQKNYYSNLLEFCLMSILDKVGLDIKKLIRIRIGLITISPNVFIHSPHVDIDRPHKVGLLYINDSDGDTIIYNEKYNQSYGENNISYYKNVLKENVSILSRSTPEENKFIMFDGMHYHSSSTPVKTSRRIVVNYAFETYS